MMTLTSEQVWQTLAHNLFAVIGMVTARGEARTAGIVYIVRDHTLYFTTGRTSWKARHIEQNPHVSMTVTIPKRLAVMPWIKIPAATITFGGLATVHNPDTLDPALLRQLYRGAEHNRELMADSCIIAVKPAGDFVTYGVGVPLLDMRTPEKARGRAPVT